MGRTPVNPADSVTHWPIDKLIPYARNSRTHSDEQVSQIAASIKEWGFTTAVLVDESGSIIAGHGRLMAARKLGLETVPVMVANGWTEAQKRAYVIADNRLAELAGWDTELLALELEELRLDGYDLDLTGFDADAIEAMFENAENSGGTEGLTDPDAVPDAPPEPVSKPGDIWIMGNHRLMCGDSTDAECVARLMNREKAQLIHADPPYGMGKEADGVANDNLYRDKLDAFQMAWWRTFRPHTADNGSAYIWGNAPDLWRLWYRGGLADSERLTMRNEIVWHKGGGGFGVGTESQRCYFPEERCLFFMLGEQGFNNNADNYWDGWDLIIDYLETERKKASFTIKDCKRIAGHSEKSGCHWFDKSQWSFPTKEVYNSWQVEANGTAFKRDYDDLKRDYDDLKRDFYATRAYFDNTHDNMTDVWEFKRVTGEERHGHATPKPVDVIARCMKSSLPDGGLCAEPFSGSGTTIIAAEKTGRRCYAMELSPAYVDVAVRRWQEFTGKQAIHAETGQPF